MKALSDVRLGLLNVQYALFSIVLFKTKPKSN